MDNLEKLFQIIFALSFPTFLFIHTFLVVKVLDSLHYSAPPSFLFPSLTFKLCITK